MRVTVYTKPGCHLCEDALDLLDKLTPQYRLQVEELNILDDMALHEAYHTQIPVIEAENAATIGKLVAPISETELRAYLEMARRESLPPPPTHTIEDEKRKTKDEGQNTPHSTLHTPHSKEPAIDRMVAYVGRHWLRLVCIVMGVFVGLPWLAPLFDWLGWYNLSHPIYSAYALTCHQLPERAGTVFGYQVAFCYRNTVLYGGLSLFGAVYGLARDRGVPKLGWMRRPLPWWGFIILLAPMAVDGITHMLGLREPMMDMVMDASFGSFYIGSQPGSLNWWLRIITGLLAAFGAVWFSFPRMTRAVAEADALREMYRQAALKKYQQAAKL